MQKTQDDLFQPEVMARFKEHGIDAVLVVQKTNGKDGLPQTVQIRLHAQNRWLMWAASTGQTAGSGVGCWSQPRRSQRR